MNKTGFLNEIVLGDCLDLFQKVPDNCVQTIHTSPPYNIERDYIGYDDNRFNHEYLDFIEKVLYECKRTLVPGGSLFWQTGYTSERKKYIIPLDHFTYHLFQKLGFRLKDRIIWRYWGGMAFKSKFTNKHETILWWIKPCGGEVSKSKFDVFLVREATKFYDSRNNLFGRNPGNVWEVDRVAFGSNDQTSHIAVFPEEISDRIVLTTTDEDDLVLDPFSGSGTLCKVAKSRGRRFLGFEISPHYHSESVSRISLQAKGELLSVLSEIIKTHVLNFGETLRINTIVEKVTSILSPFSLKPYEKKIKKSHLDAICSGCENGVKKSEKISLWKDFEKILPPFGSSEIGNDEFGLISIVDQAYMKAYKLHKVYSSAMRFYLVAKWLSTLQSALEPNKKEGWETIIKSLAKSETGMYRLKNERITRSTLGKKIKEAIVEIPAPRSSQKKMTPTLFDSALHK